MAETLKKKKPSGQVGDLVTYSLKVDDKPISESLEIVSINIHHEINVITRATIVIVDADPATEDFKISSSNQFFPGKKIEISLGYNHNNVITFTGIIISNAQKANNDCAMLTLECKDEIVMMTLDKNSIHHDKVTTATDIA